MVVAFHHTVRKSLNLSISFVQLPNSKGAVRPFLDFQCGRHFFFAGRRFVTLTKTGLLENESCKRFILYKGALELCGD